MKLAILSDLHLEMRRKTARKFVDDLDPTGVDVAVLAGDICEAEAA